MNIKNKPGRELLYKLYVEDELSIIDISKIYNCDPGTVKGWLRKDKFEPKLCECGCGGYAKTGNKFIIGHNTRKTPWKPNPELQLCECGCGNYAEPGRKFINGHNRKNIILSDKIREKISEGKLLVREKIREKSITYWEDPIEREKASAIKQDQDYDAGEWTGFVDNLRPHLIPAPQCIHLNPWFEGCNQHHIIPSVIINIPTDLHKSVWHRMPHDKQKEKNMEEINELAFKYLLGQL